MICRNCQTEVDDDLIFCTNCGERLFEPPEEQPTVLIGEPVYTKPETPKPPKSSSNLKWAALIVALVAIPASIFGILLLQSQNRQVSQSTAPPKTPTAAPTRKSNSNQNSNLNANSANSKTTNTNANANSANAGKKTEIMNESLEIDPKSHETVSFEVEKETAKINGKITILEGDKIDGFVYLKKSYEDHFPDENFKMFSFGTSKTTEVRQTLVREDYVLVFVNNTDKPVVIQGNFSIE
jgi:hypothetical protein